MDFEHELKRVADSYTDQGYEVTLRPGPDRLPPFAKDFKVEIVGKRGTQGVLVAVKKTRDDLAADPNVQRYAEVIGTQPGWRFDLAVLKGSDPNARDLRDAREFSDEEIGKSLTEAEKIAGMGFGRAGVITAWAALEAAMRMRLRAIGRPAGWGSSPREMLNELYSSGLLSADEFRRLEGLFKLRNQIVHGFSPTSANGASDAGEVRFLSEVTQRLVRESQSVKQSA
jgi:uncharacterized protein YutE (UPF0331/DUF86 family)